MHELININDLLKELIEQFSTVAGRDVKISFRPSGNYQVCANQLLKDVFSNLIDNSIKHSEGSLVIIISTSAIYADKKMFCRIIVEDSGPGIPDNKKANLFNFSMVTRQKAVGKGLGLYLVKTLVEDFRGKIFVEDRVPGDYTKGSKFVVMLPAVTRVAYPATPGRSP